MRSIRAVLYLAIGSALALVGSRVSAQAAADTLRLAERVEALNAVLSPYLGVLPTPLNIEPCSIFVALSRNPKAVQQLRPEIQIQLTDLKPAACKDPRDIAYKTPAWIIRSIHREGNNRLRVVAQVIPRAAYTYNVEYQLIPAVRRDGAISWVVNEVRLYDFVSYVFH